MHTRSGLYGVAAIGAATQRLGFCGGTRQGRESRMHTVAYCSQVVAAFEKRDHICGRREIDKLRNEVAVVAAREAQRGEGIIAMRVVPHRKQQPRRCEALERGADNEFDRGAVCVTCGSCRHRDVDRGTAALTCAGLRQRSGAGIERELVQRHKQHPRVAVERILRTVTVMGIQIDDRYAFTTITQRGRRDRDGVQKTEPHGTLRSGVMARWSHGTERSRCLTTVDVAHRRQAASCGQKRCPSRPPRHGRIRVDDTAALCIDGLKAADNRFVVHAFDVDHRHRLRGDDLDGDARVDQPVAGGGQSFTTLGMCRTGIVVKTISVRHVQKGHRATAYSWAPHETAGRGVACMSKLALLTFGTEHYRIGSWRGHETLGYLAPLSAPQQLTAAGLQRAMTRLARSGYKEILTAALSEPEQAFFLRAGFTVHERLHLLRHDLTNVSATNSRPAELRRIHRWHHRALLELDQRAFDPFWKLDQANLIEAIQATPTTRVVGMFMPELVAYAVTGLAGDQGYLQRLAVDPDRQGSGIATRLVTDTLTWLAHRHATAASVNTQETNHRALALYEHLGFRLVQPGLAVLRCELRTP